MVPSPSPTTCVAFLLRHGATDSNLSNPPRLQGRSIDGPLSPAGQRQALSAGQQLARLPIKAVYSSPLLRARETAARIADPLRLETTLVADLIEVDVGQWERRSWIEIEAEEPEAYQAFQNDPAQFGYRGGENLTDVRDRVVPAITTLVQRHQGQMIAIVGHNVVNRAFLADAIGLPLSRARNIYQDNCGINILSWQNGAWKIWTINSILHLEDTRD